MAEPTPKPSEPTPDAPQPEGKAVIPVGGEVGRPAPNTTPNEPPKSSRAITKTYRVRELPPPPRVVPDAAAEGAEPRPANAPVAAEVADLPIQSIAPRQRAKMPGGKYAAVAVAVVVLLLLANHFYQMRSPHGASHKEVAQAQADEKPSTDAKQAESPPAAPAKAEPAVGPALEKKMGEKKMAEAPAVPSVPAAPSPPAPDKTPKPATAAPPVTPPPPVAPAPPSNPPTAPPPDPPAPSPSSEHFSGTTLPPSMLPEKVRDAADRLTDGKFSRRNPKGRSEGVGYGGGNFESEKAVEAGLKWLVAHQKENGAWSFNHQTELCMHYCTNPGTEPSSTAATGLALLPFLGAGHTHKAGDYQDTVQRGLDYLVNKGIVISYGIDYRDASMYGHALATLALCEAYAMTKDEKLKAAAQGGLDYIAYVQDHNGGGWRYNPGEPGDTTVTGWMLMALKSGQMARLNVQSPVLMGAERFLNSVQNKDGSQYGYQTRKPKNGTTAVGLLCRMYTGWKHDQPGLAAGVAHLAKLGPSEDELYYDYYATQVLYHYSGREWVAWNIKMRDHLVSSQAREGHPAGSWFFASLQSDAGGRLYNTAMAVMILEVYYRVMPLYGEKAVESR